MKLSIFRPNKCKITMKTLCATLKPRATHIDLSKCLYIYTQTYMKLYNYGMKLYKNTLIQNPQKCQKFKNA